jgi:hypothetical protein
VQLCERAGEAPEVGLVGGRVMSMSPVAMSMPTRTAGVAADHDALRLMPGEHLEDPLQPSPHAG